MRPSDKKAEGTLKDFSTKVWTLKKEFHTIRVWRRLFTQQKRELETIIYVKEGFYNSRNSRTSVRKKWTDNFLRFIWPTGLI